MMENNINLMFTRKARLAVQKCSVMGTNREGLSIAGLPFFATLVEQSLV